jgi:quinol-cytochrome oxidoreductase complex cytochrome b subunit
MSTEGTRSPEPADSSGETAAPPAKGILGFLEDQFALRRLISEYFIPVETNTIWYTLGGVLGIAIALEILTGTLLALKYHPDAGQAYTDTYNLIHSDAWYLVIGFHYFNAFLIFGLVMLHMTRVFVSGGYRRGKMGLWFVGVALAGLTFIAVLTGESLHWDEVGFAVPWHVSEVFQAFHIDERFGYTFADLKSVGSATTRLLQIYALHVAVVPILLILTMLMHYYLVREKGISVPFWHRASGRKAPFSEHMRAWVIYGTIIIGGVFLWAVFVHRGAGTPPQLLPDSPLYGSAHGPGGLGYKPSFPISWTHGMNVFFGKHLGIEPDIWGSIVGMGLMFLALLAVPFLDRSNEEPKTWLEALSWRQRGLAFLALAVFWVVMITGVVQNAIAGPS